ncbi:hypothetical protein QJS10_CPA03g01712 [Acorus calamus]|uniref:Uncharacterized protein n=1 Tax=Acorus calamus TaxID=4465 RepID=A0AAV9F445_ACOCL|nr:hypothetical protein QJS10_CPA03g01712 [Acorus calamus]
MTTTDHRAIVQYRHGETASPPILGSNWFNESPSSSAYYMRLPGDSGRFSTAAVSSAVTVSVNNVSQSPHRRSTSRRLA